MSKFGISQPVRRIEDTRFLRGEGRYVDDVKAEGALHAYILRSPIAHATIASIDVAAAAEAPGVRLVVTGADLDAAMDHDMDAVLVKSRDGSDCVKPRRPVLAIGKVRFVGDPVAAVIADTLDAARDAAELIEVEYDELEPVLDMRTADQPGRPQLHEEAANNLSFDWAMGDEAATEAALKASARVVELDLVNNRVIAAPMENRAVLADWKDGEMTITYNGQGVWRMKDEVARRFSIPAEKVHVVTEDVGGAFGMKAFNYPEHFVAVHATKTLGRPVKWIGDRSESILMDGMGRDNVTKLWMGFDKDHRITAMKALGISNLGAYLAPAGSIQQTFLPARVLTGVYDIRTVWFNVKGVFTNMTPTDAYRGAGRPEAQYALERLMDKSARVLGVDPVELRKKNFITPAQMPYTTVANETYDVGDFARVMDRGLAEADWAGFAARKAESARAGKLRGRGLCYYIESILGAPNETAKIVFAEDGGVDLHVGTQSGGQGHETVYTQILHDQTGIPFDRIRIVQGDSDRVATGGGTGGSRSVTTQGTAIYGASADLIDKMRPLAEEELEAAAADLVWEDGAWRVAGTDKAVDLVSLAAIAREKGMTELLSQETETRLPGRSFPNGCHIAEVEIDPDTGKTEVVRYTVTDDFGRLMNPMLAEGQVHGGVVQGIGQALTEHVVYDETGQLLSASFMDYAIPRAVDAPMIPFHSEPVFSTANIIGMKGCGEAGTVGALAAVTNAALDAVWDEGVRQIDMPLTPQRVWSWLNQPKAA